MKVIGIDIGGTKVSTSIGDENGNILASKRIPTRDIGESEGGLKTICDQVRGLLHDAETHLIDIDGIGVGAPGPVNVRSGLLLNPPNLNGWSNVPLVEAIQDELGRPVFMNNDANGAALAEYLFGSCKGTPNMVYLTTSTGMGGGIIANGKLLLGAADMAGEVGHFVLDPSGPPHGGLKGSFEAFCGGLSIANRVREHIRNGVKTSISESCSGKLDTIDFAMYREAVRAGDTFAVEMWDEFIEHLAQGIGVLLMTLNPGAIVLGTIAIHSGDLMFDPLRKALPKYAWKQAIDACRIVPSALADKIGDLSALAIAVTALQDPATS